MYSFVDSLSNTSVPPSVRSVQFMHLSSAIIQFRVPNYYLHKCIDNGQVEVLLLRLPTRQKPTSDLGVHLRIARKAADSHKGDDLQKMANNPEGDISADNLQ